MSRNKLSDMAREKIQAKGPKFMDEVLRGIANGDTDVTAAKKFGMFLDEWEAHKKHDPDFARLVRQAHAEFAGQVEYTMKTRAKQGDAKAASAWLSKRQAEVFGTERERKQIDDESSSSGGGLVVVTGFPPKQQEDDGEDAEELI